MMFRASIIFSLFFTVLCHLIVNVKNKGGDVYKQKIEANATADTVTLEFSPKDGTHFIQFIDFKSDVQIFRIYVPWEEERGIVQSKPQMLCFVTRFGKNEFISSDAMSKLRQKNPTAVRLPEEDRGVEKHTLNVIVNLANSSELSPHIKSLCHEALDSTYAHESDIKLISQVLNKDLRSMMAALKFTDLEKLPRCKDTTEGNKSCICQYHMCIGWYPCALKYCRGKDSTGNAMNYRCGIKTCRRCLLFEYFAQEKIYCLWDDL